VTVSGASVSYAAETYTSREVYIYNWRRNGEHKNKFGASAIGAPGRSTSTIGTVSMSKTAGTSLWDMVIIYVEVMGWRFRERLQSTGN
jgi:hypothetical protein